MYEYELKRVKKYIKSLFLHDRLKNKNIYLFGVSDNTRQIIKILRSFDLEPENIIENDQTKIHSYCSQVWVISLNEIPDTGNHKNIFLLYSAFWREMYMQLQKETVFKKNIINLYGKRKSLSSHLNDAVKGKIVYTYLKKKYGNAFIFACPYTGTGDIYLIGTFWKQYLTYLNLDKYIFLVISSACKKTADLFDIENVIVLKKKKYMGYLLDYYLLCFGKTDIKILNDSWGQIHTNPIQWFRGYKGLNFTEMFRQFVFDLPNGSTPSVPVLKNADKEILDVFEALHLKRGKTIVLSPYSNTLADLSSDFWAILAQMLKEKGYCVCTNTGGKHEEAVSGTIPLFFPLNIAPQFISEAGYFIGIRSGFCDIISSAHAKKIILYDAGNRFYNCSAYEYFNLKYMGLCDDAVEIEFKNSNIEEVQKKIMKYF